jgi:hypothetical protein
MHFTGSNGTDTVYTQAQTSLAAQIRYFFNAPPTEQAAEVGEENHKPKPVRWRVRTKEIATQIK